MKKVNLERMNSDLFGKFEAHKLNSLAASNVKGGGATKTTLCVTEESTMDTDSQGSKENPSDSRCSGYGEGL